MAVRFAEPRRTTGPGAGAVAIVGASGLLAAAAMDPATIEEGPVLCPFRLATGLPCPGCGLTRSWVYAMHGEWANAVAANPFGLLTLAASVLLVIVVTVRVLRRRPAPDLGRFVSNRAVKAVAAAWLVFAVARLLSAGTSLVL